MRAHGIQGAKRRGKPWRTTIADPAARAAARICVERDFTAAGPDGCGWRTSAYLRCWEGWCSSRSSSTSTAAGSSAGSSPATCAPTSSSTRCGWRSRAAAAAPTSSSCITRDAGSQYTAYAFTQVLDDHGVLGSIGSVGDAYDNALAESFVDCFKTELIADRVWRTRTQLELAIVEYVGWFNHARLHEALGDIPPVEFEQRHAAKAAISGNGSVAALSPKAADRLYAPALSANAPTTRNVTLWHLRTKGPGCAGSHPPLIEWKPTNPVSVDPSPAHSS